MVLNSSREKWLSCYYVALIISTFNMKLPFLFIWFWLFLPVLRSHSVKIFKIVIILKLFLAVFQVPLERKKRYIAIRKEAREAGNGDPGMKFIYDYGKNCHLTFHTLFIDTLLIGFTVSRAHKSIHFTLSYNQFPSTLKFQWSIRACLFVITLTNGLIFFLFRWTQVFSFCIIHDG